MKKLIFLPLLVSCLAVNATNYFVSPSGSDANNGTSTATPWKTIAKVNGYHFYPGDVIMFKRGCVWRETLLPPYSGAAGKPITFSAYGTGAKPVINGADIYTGWTSYNSRIWSRNSPLSNNVTPTLMVDGVIYSRVTTMGALVKNTFYLSKTGYPDKLYIYSESDANKKTVEISTRKNAIYLRLKSYISISNLNVINCSDAGIRLEGDGIYDGNPGVYFKGYSTIDSVAASNSVNFGIVTGNGYSYTTIKNSSAYSNGNGFYAEANADHTLFQKDTAFNNYSRIDPFTDGNGIGVYKSSFNTIENCLAYSNKNGCGIEIDLDGTDSAIVIRYNTVHGNGSLSDFFCGIKTGNLTGKTSNLVYYNLSYLNGNDPVDQRGREFYHHNGNIAFYNNTAYTTGISSAYGLTIAGTGMVTVKNNIFYSYGGAYIRCVRRFNTSILIADRNLYYSTTPAPFYDSSTTYDFSGWKRLRYNDAHSINANPLFAINGSNFTLQATSPAIDKGANVGLTRDILGNPIAGLPDIGAYETPALISSSTNSSANQEEKIRHTVIYPNPVAKILNVRLPDSNALKAEIYIFDMAGKKVMPAVIVNNPNGPFLIPINVANLTRGMYSIHIFVPGEKKMAATFLKL